MHKDILEALEEIINAISEAGGEKEGCEETRDVSCKLREGDWVSFRIPYDFSGVPVELRYTGCVMSVEGDSAKIRPVADVREDAVILGFSRTVELDELTKICPPNTTVIIPPTN